MRCVSCDRAWSWSRVVCSVVVGVALALIGTSATASAAAISVSLTASQSAPQTVGTPITFTATASDSNPVVYQFRMGSAGGPYHVVQDFSVHNSFTWTPLQEGSQTVVVKVKEGFAATKTSSASLAYCRRGSGRRR